MCPEMVSFIKMSDERRWRLWSYKRAFASSFYLRADKNKGVWLAFMSTCSTGLVGIATNNTKSGGMLGALARYAMAGPKQGMS